MAIVDGYCTLDTLKGELQIDNADADARLERVIESVSRSIDEYCGQFFHDTVTDQTRYFTARHSRRRGSFVVVDPLRTVTTLSVATVDGGTYTAWDASQYRLEPRNNPTGSPSKPYEAVRALRRNMGCVLDGVEIVGVFGWAATPNQVEEACLLQSSRIQKRRDAPFGIADVPTAEGGGMRLSARLDPDVELMLKPFRRVGGSGMLV